MISASFRRSHELRKEDVEQDGRPIHGGVGPADLVEEEPFIGIVSAVKGRERVHHIGVGETQAAHQQHLAEHVKVAAGNEVFKTEQAA
jgi:hypothetical protein